MTLKGTLKKIYKATVAVPAKLTGWPLVVDKYVLLKDAGNTPYHQDIFPVVPFERIEPKTNRKPLHWKFLKGAHGITTHAEPVAGRVLKEAKVLGPAGTIITGQSQLIYDASTEICLTPETHSIFNRIIYQKPKRLSGLGLNLSASQSHENYFHWMTDAVPKLALALKSGYQLDSFDYFIVNSKNRVFQQQTLQMLGIPAKKIIALDEQPYLICESLFVTTATCASGNVSPWIIDFLRNSFLSEDITSSKTKIFVGRKNASRRKLLNEAELAEMLTKYGFHTVYLEDLSIAEQANLFAGAELIIAAHGAGFTNLVFCRPGTKIIEMFPPTYINQGFWTISSVNHLDYGYLIGEGEEVPDNHDLLRNIDFTVPIDEVRSFLKYD